MVIRTTEQVSSEVLKITSDSELAFFIRTEYLHIVLPEDILPDSVFEDELEQDILGAALCYAAEVKATDYLARCEQSRFGLTKKLLEKGHEKQAINSALDYLERRGFLSDERFARAWLSSRRINHYEGRTRLFAELSTRGISKETAETALDEFFLEHDELSLCKKAYSKVISACSDEEKIIRRLMTRGFSYKMIKTVMLESD